jgi:hypothetical protein
MPLHDPREDPDEARAKIDPARAALRAVIEAQDGEVEPARLQAGPGANAYADACLRRPAVVGEREAEECATADLELKTRGASLQRE